MLSICSLSFYDSDEEEKKKQQQKNDIDKLDDPDVGDDQINPYHNELEEPPEPDDMELGKFLLRLAYPTVPFSLNLIENRRRLQFGQRRRQ